MVDFCDADDVANRLRRALTSAEEEYVDAVIAEAQALVVAYLNRGEEPFETVEDVPSAVTVVTSRMVARVFQQDGQPIGAETLTAGPFATKYVAGANSGSPWLANTDKLTLRPHRRSMSSVTVASERGYDACLS
jgi:hypothetical protein